MFKLHFLFLLLLPFFLKAQSYPVKPENYVTDEAHVLSTEQQSLLDAKLKDFETKTSNQLFIYIAPSLNGNDLDSYSQEIFHNWKIGTENKDNGLLIAVFVNDHKFRIQTGYGLEGSLPDLLTKKIQDETMRSYFKQSDFYTGIDKGVDKLIYYSANAYTADDIGTSSNSDITGLLYGYIPNLILLAIFCYNLFKKNPNKERKPVTKNILLVVAIILALVPCIGSIFLFFMLFFVITIKYSSGSYSSGGGGSYWSSGSDSSSSYSSSDSGFSGGGGGDSGGGGSSSDW
ncbi:MAG: TPM domain-containing protein [Bacteroidota bacterium]